MAENQDNSLFQFAIASVVISLMLSVYLYGYINSPQMQENLAPGVILMPGLSQLNTLVSQNDLGTVACQNGQSNCTDAMKNPPAQTVGQFDPVQSMVSIAKLAGKLLVIIGMTASMPFIISNITAQYISNSWLTALIGLFVFAWWALVAYAIVKWFMNRRQ